VNPPKLALAGNAFYWIEWRGGSWIPWRIRGGGAGRCYTKLACAWISHLFLTTALLDAFLDALLDAHSGDL